jgi:hypothetical protein
MYDQMKQQVQRMKTDQQETRTAKAKQKEVMPCHDSWQL